MWEDKKIEDQISFKDVKISFDMALQKLNLFLGQFKEDTPDNYNNLKDIENVINVIIESMKVVNTNIHCKRNINNYDRNISNAIFEARTYLGY